MHLSKLRSSVVSVSNLRRLYDVLNAYDPYDVATAVYVIAVQFADYATACEAFAAGSTTLDDDVARAFECGLDAVDGDGSEPFSLAYAGVTSGGRRALHEAGNSQLCDRAFRQRGALLRVCVRRRHRGGGSQGRPVFLARLAGVRGDGSTETRTTAELLAAVAAVRAIAHGPESRQGAAARWASLAANLQVTHANEHGLFARPPGIPASGQRAAPCRHSAE